MTEEDLPDPAEITFDGERYPARPQRLRPRANLRTSRIQRSFSDPRSADASNVSYVEWLLRQSMLRDAQVLSRGLSGQPSMWRNPYAKPDSRRAIRTASVWFTAYPISLITEPGKSYLAALGDERLWEAFETIGIAAVHTGPVKRAGGITGWGQTASVDGHFDRISTQIDPAFGSEEEFRSLADIADQYGGSVIDDIVPGHTGKGADFRLAEMAYKDYPGIYHMLEIPEEDWSLLPDVPEGRDSVNLNAATERELAEQGYIIGELQRVIFFSPGTKETNWSATGPVLGVDGITRRWVYLHYFKQGQPSINWLDPTFAGMRLVIGDALHSLGDLGSSALRLDANGFLGVEKSVAGMPAWSEGHHPRHRAGGSGPLVRLHQPPRVPPRSRDGRHGVPAAHAAHFSRARRGAGEPRARPAEPRRAHLRARALGHPAQCRHLRVPRRGDQRRPARRDDPRRPDRAPDRRRVGLQPRVHHQRHRLHHRLGDRGDAGPHHARRHRRRRRGRHLRGAPAAREVQRLAARRVRGLGLGPARNAPAAATPAGWSAAPTTS
jgi:hypothetical protein